MVHSGIRRVLNNIIIVGEPDTKIYSVRFSDDDKYIAAATHSGEVQIYNLNSMRKSYTLQPEDKKGVSFSCVKWRPKNAARKTKNVLVTTNADGEIQFWHMNSGKFIGFFFRLCYLPPYLGKLLSTIKEEGREPTLNSLDYNADGLKFAVVGNAACVSFFHQGTMNNHSVLIVENI